MWVKVDDAFPEHRKVFVAARQLGPYATGRVLAVWLEAICWVNRQETDGIVPLEVVRTFRHDRDPLDVAGALVYAGLWNPCEGGWEIHDYHDYQFDGAKRANLSEVRAAAGRRGAMAKWQTDGKPMANGCPVPVPVPKDQDQELSYAREQPPVSVVRVKGKYQPNTKGAWTCPHDPPCGLSTTKCIAQALAEAKAGKDA